MKTLSILAISSLLLVSTAFAVEKPEEGQPKAGQPKVEKQAYVATVQVAGRTIAIVNMAEQPSDARMSIEGSKIIHDPSKAVLTFTGKSTIEVRQGGKRLLQVIVEDGVVTLWPVKELPGITEMLKSKALPKIIETPKSKAKT